MPKRALKDLDLMDSFLFNASTERIQDAEVIARIVVERATGQKLGKVIVETEKQMKGVDAERRGIRLDLFISEMNNEKVARVYDIEPNNYNLKALPRRDRYNQALSDTKLLSVSDNFEALPEYISIWILPTDPFGRDRMIYTVKNIVEECNDVVYNDGVKRIFLNAKGTIGGNEKLKTLLQYFCNSCEANVADPDIEMIHSIVTGVKQDRKVGEQYMTWKEVIKYEAEALALEMVEEMMQEKAEELAQEKAEAMAEELVETMVQDSTLTFIRNGLGNGVTKELMEDMLVKGYLITREEAREKICIVCETQEQ